MSIVGSAVMRDWSVSVSDDNHRSYPVLWQVQTDDIWDGPTNVLAAPGLPFPGASFAIGNASDPWAFYYRQGTAKLRNFREGRQIWDVTTVFSTKPARRCHNQQYDNPLLEPHRVRGSFQPMTREAEKDKDGKVITNSAQQRIKGAIVEVDDGRPVIELDMNVAWLNTAFLAEHRNAVNDNTWWGHAKRTVKCSEFSWERVNYGTCSYYFVANFRFELNEDTWDIQIPDEGTRKLKSGKPIGSKNEDDYINITDDNENLVVKFLKDGSVKADQSDPVILKKRVYPEKNFATVGWPSTLM